MAGERVTMKGELGFKLHGHWRTAPVTLVAMRTSKQTWSCVFTVTFEVKEYTATFPVPVANHEQQGAAVKKQIIATLLTWPKPWPELHEVTVDLHLA